MASVLGLKALSVAEGEIGNGPCPEKPSPTCRTWGPAMEKYLKSVGIARKGGGYDYCSAFVNWCFQQAATGMGRSSPLDQQAGGLHIARTPGGIYRWAKSQNRLVIAPERGDIFLTDDLGHAGIVAEVKGDSMDTVEGNTWIRDHRWGVWKRTGKALAGNYFVRLT